MWERLTQSEEPCTNPLRPLGDGVEPDCESLCPLRRVLYPADLAREESLLETPPQLSHELFSPAPPRPLPLSPVVVGAVLPQPSDEAVEVTVCEEERPWLVVVLVVDEAEELVRCDPPFTLL